MGLYTHGLNILQQLVQDWSCVLTNTVLYVCNKKSGSESNQIDLVTISPEIPDGGLRQNHSGGQTSKLPIKKKKEAIAMVQAQGLGSPAMNTRSKVPSSPDNPVMGTRSKKKLLVWCVASSFCKLMGLLNLLDHSGWQKTDQLSPGCVLLLLLCEGYECGLL